MNLDLQDTKAIFFVLGCIMKDTDILLSTEFQLDINDFPQRFHKTIFASIKHLTSTGAKELTPVDVDSYLSNYVDQYKDYEENNGLEWLQDAIEISSVETFQYNVERIKKFTLLRELDEAGFDIKPLYDGNSEAILKQFDKMSIDDIINYYNKQLLQVERNVIHISEGKHISDNADLLVKELRYKPTIGLDTGMAALNYYVYGLRKKYYLFSAKTGEGKTRIQAFLALLVGYYQQTPCLLISTEVPIDEVQTMMIAHLAKVPERKILLNQLTEKEKEHVDWATEELKKAKIDIIYLPDFTLEAVEHTIKRYILNREVEYIFFDYIKESISMIEGLNKKVGQVDGWKALNLFSERLKGICEQYKVGIVSATQLSQAGTTSGSSAIPNAVDVWCKLRFASQEEIDLFSFLALPRSQAGQDDDGLNRYAMMAIDVEKNRRGMKDFTLYLKADLGTLSFYEVGIAKNGNAFKLPTLKISDKIWNMSG